MMMEHIGSCADVFFLKRTALTSQAVLFIYVLGEERGKPMNKKSPMNIIEPVFDITYLAFDLIAGIIFFAKAQGRPVLILYGILALLLGAGDAFHLVPRVERYLKGEDERTEWKLGLGLAVSSVTMTVFYFLLYAIYGILYGWPSAVFVVLVFGFGILRIILCLFPQNNWFHAEGNARWSLYRNIPFAIVGIAMIVLELSAGTAYGAHMAIAIAISFGCYLPVTLFAKKHPAVGALMMPKTLAYVWMIAIGLGLLSKM